MGRPLNSLRCDKHGCKRLIGHESAVVNGTPFTLSNGMVVSEKSHLCSYHAGEIELWLDLPHRLHKR